MKYYQKVELLSESWKAIGHSTTDSAETRAQQDVGPECSREEQKG